VKFYASEAKWTNSSLGDSSVEYCMSDSYVNVNLEFVYAALFYHKRLALVGCGLMVLF